MAACLADAGFLTRFAEEVFLFKIELFALCTSVTNLHTCDNRSDFTRSFFCETYVLSVIPTRTRERVGWYICCVWWIHRVALSSIGEGVRTRGPLKPSSRGWNRTMYLVSFSITTAKTAPGHPFFRSSENAKSDATITTTSTRHRAYCTATRGRKRPISPPVCGRHYGFFIVSTQFLCSTDYGSAVTDILVGGWLPKGSNTGFLHRISLSMFLMPTA